MIIAAHWSTDGSVTFDYELDENMTAFIDGEWASSRGNIPAVLVSATGDVASWDGYGVQSRRKWFGAEVPDPEAVAADVVRAIARAAVDALPEGTDLAVDVTGSGVVASSIRSVLPASAAPLPRGARRGAHPERFLAVVDTTGSSAVIMAAATRLADGGTIVLAGPSASPPSPVNMYSDVHRRGLRLVGIPPLPKDGYGGVGQVGGAQPAAPRQPISPASWYRLEVEAAK